MTSSDDQQDNLENIDEEFETDNFDIQIYNKRFGQSSKSWKFSPSSSFSPKNNSNVVEDANLMGNGCIQPCLVPIRLHAKNGSVKGKWDIPSSGMLVIKLDNKFSRLRGKKVNIRLVVKKSNVEKILKLKKLSSKKKMGKKRSSISQVVIHERSNLDNFEINIKGYNAVIVLLAVFIMSLLNLYVIFFK